MNEAAAEKVVEAARTLFESEKAPHCGGWGRCTAESTCSVHAEFFARRRKTQRENKARLKAALGNITYE